MFHILDVFDGVGLWDCGACDEGRREGKMPEMCGEYQWDEMS